MYHRLWNTACQKVKMFLTPSTIFYGEHRNYQRRLVSDYLIHEIQNRRDICNVGLPTFYCFTDTVTKKFCFHCHSVFDIWGLLTRVLLSPMMSATIKGQVASSCKLASSLQRKPGHKRFVSLGLAPLFIRYEMSRALREYRDTPRSFVIQ